MNQPVYMADIQNKIYEAGLIRQEERIVLTAENCVLLEYYTGKTYSYRMVELSTLKTKQLFSKSAPLNKNGYQKAMSQTFTVPLQGTDEPVVITMIDETNALNIIP